MKILNSLTASVNYSLCLVLSLAFACTGPEKNNNIIASPDGQISVQFHLEDSIPAYAIRYNDQVALENSRLGLIREDVDLSTGMTLVEASPVEKITDEYELLHGKKRQIRYEANEKIFHLASASGQKMDVIFRVSNDGVAFRYYFPETSESKIRINEEVTSFNFPEGTKAWLQPMAVVKTGWSETNPSYEENYHQEIDAGTPAPTEAGWVYPALFRSGDVWTLITEAGLGRKYCGTKLRQHAPDGEYVVGFPQKGEQIPGGALFPEAETPLYSPWRIIAIGSLKTITESTLGTDLADPAVEMDQSFIQPGQASWSWAILKDNSVVYDVQKRFIDFAAEMNYEYCLIDVNWDTTIGYDKIAELSEYAQSKNVGILLWYNSSGDWNTTEYHPKSKLLTHEQRVEEFSRLKEMGIRGIKVDFFAGDGQSMINYYLDIFEDAADYNLMVNCHGSTIPRGWHRTYPNLMTMESVKGFEFITFVQENADVAPAHGAMLPFTRNAFDPMDFTPMSLYEIPGIERRTTNGYELATTILFLSGIQHLAETPEGMATTPDYVQDFVRNLPDSWEDSRFIDGYPGKLAVIARKDSDKWFVGGINGEDKSKTVSLDLSFIGDSASGTIITDGEEAGSFSTKEINVSDEPVEVTMKGNGGFVMVF